MASFPIPVPVPVFDNVNLIGQDFDDMDNWDDVLTGVFSFFDNECNKNSRVENNTVLPQSSPITLAPQNFAVVTPCSSANELSEASMLEPTAISEMMTPFANTFVNPLPRTLSSVAPSMNFNTSVPVTEIPKSNPKKRRQAVIEDEPFFFGGQTEVHEQRRERNREHARKSRQRKKSLTEGLQQSMVELKEENAKLREQVYALIGEKEADSMVEARLLAPTENFIAALKEPANRVVDDETKQFLRGLRKKLPADIYKKVHVVG